jgi:bifunctional DNA-binding transcriptional regulator/antitoxin component of YhaV-PrlF toxin-antitoxin module
MRVAIDAVGRMVVPKSLRAELGITGPAEVEVVSTEGHLELSVPDMPAHVEMRDGLAVIVTDRPVPPMTASDVRKALEEVRR